MNAGAYCIDNENILICGGCVKFGSSPKVQDSDKVIHIEFYYNDATFIKTLKEPLAVIYQPFNIDSQLYLVSEKEENSKSPIIIKYDLEPMIKFIEEKRQRTHKI